MKKSVLAVLMCLTGTVALAEGQYSDADGSWTVQQSSAASQVGVAILTEPSPDKLDRMAADRARATALRKCQIFGVAQLTPGTTMQILLGTIQGATQEQLQVLQSSYTVICGL